LWIEEAKAKGYLIEMYFFCLDSIQTAKERVYIRTQNNGHNVSDEIIEYKWKEVYKNINLNFKLFDYLSFIDNSANDIPALLFEILKIDETHFQFIQLVKQLPNFIETRLPSIFNQLIK
jgi:predicted ABC-type ATPase